MKKRKIELDNLDTTERIETRTWRSQTEDKPEGEIDQVEEEEPQSTVPQGRKRQPRNGRDNNSQLLPTTPYLSRPRNRLLK